MLTCIHFNNKCIKVCVSFFLIAFLIVCIIVYMEIELNRRTFRRLIEQQVENIYLLELLFLCRSSRSSFFLSSYNKVMNITKTAWSFSLVRSYFFLFVLAFVFLATVRMESSPNSSGLDQWTLPMSLYHPEHLMGGSNKQ